MAARAEYGLKKVVWQKIKDTIITDCRKSEVWKILILDYFTTKLMSSCCKMSDLMSEGITIVEDLFKIREPVPQMKAIYFISPTEECVEALVNDFKKKPKYKAAYVYFTDYCDDALFFKMKQHCGKFIRVCKEINLAFLPHESQVFTCDNAAAFKSIYGVHSKDKERTLETLADQIVTLCATLEENPGIRYRESSLGHAKKLAELVDQKLTHHFEIEGNTTKKAKTQAQLLIVERGFDPATPVLHELTYQAMAYDLIPIKNDIYKYKTKDGSEKEALLNEEDELWVKLRHMHVAQVSEQIPKLVKEISASKKPSDAKNLTISGLSQLMKKMPSFRKQLAQKVVHLNLTEDCMKQFQDSVEKLCKAEQDLALGADAEGQKVKDPMRTLLPVLLYNHSVYDKIRAVLLYIFSLNGTTEENLSKLIQHVKIENESEFILNWKELGVPVISPGTASFPVRKPSRRERAEETYSLSRWTPIIKDVMEDVLERKLDTREWPHQSTGPAAWNGSGAVSARQKHKPNAQDERRSGSRLIIFIIGGIGYSEMRCAYEVMQAVKSCEVIIGSSHIVTPTSLLDDIKTLSKPPMETFEIMDEKSVAK
ncbi:syntaxin-binding protein 3 isoform X1 [Paramormyrops kingsleyae]|uniref:Syntaxin binding protein 3 n=2 Tax=Paramormyrops kingsleyae TaxID=1676925 RepID=A0A3B3TDH9_9TELE|nr:syntaxin-binding protein 3 isoform X1 [Paramormyrops kingsleyae]